MVDNRKRLLKCGFLALTAAAMGFGIRGGILGVWASEYGFTKLELGTITGGGLVGFGVVILIASFFIERVGFKKVLALAFILHCSSAFLTIAASPIFWAFGKTGVYWILYIGMFLFSVANGLCEGVINPLIAAAYSKRKTHYLNILHAGWPAGLIIGGLLAHFLVGKVPWEFLMVLFLIPTGIYGWIVLKETFPKPQSQAAGLSFPTMLKELAAPVFAMLIIAHAGIGYVELGTDSWIANITDRMLIGKGLVLFVYASSIMCILRFFAGPIVKHINPLGLLCCSAIMGAVGLITLSNGQSQGVIWLAVGIYAVGKTFLWPTMLGIVGDQFPRGGALAMGAIGGIGFLSAGLIGGPAIGYKQDYAASHKLKSESQAVYKRYAASESNGFLVFPAIRGLDGAKVSVLKDNGVALAKTSSHSKTQNFPLGNAEKLNSWWMQARLSSSEDRNIVLAAELYGGRMALKWTAWVPIVLFFIFLLLALYYRASGGYKPVDL